MKKLLPFISLLLCSVSGFSQTGSLLFSENFTSLNIGDLSVANNPANGWVNNVSTPLETMVQVKITSPLTYTGYTSGTNYVRLAHASSTWDDPYRLFIGSASISATTSSFYMSFVVSVPNTDSTVAASASTRTCLSLQNGTGSNNICNFYIGDANSGANLRFGINKTGNTGASWHTTNRSFGTTYLIVIRYDFVSGSNNDRMYMWVNPSLASEPTTASAAVSITSGTDAATPVASVGFEQTSNGAGASFDGIKVAYGTGATGGTTAQNQAANSAFAWGQLAPAGAPLPIKIYYFNAAKGNAVNTLNWKAECSSTQATFEVLRSYDGINFNTINTLTASQARCAQPFNYQDNTAAAGTVYYRLKVIDVDGKASYSAIVKLTSQVKDIELAGIAPNPVANSAQLKINTTKKEMVDLAIISADGKVVYRNSVQLEPGSSVVNLEIANLPSGMYMIKGMFSDGQTNTIQFLKK